MAAQQNTYTAAGGNRLTNEARLFYSMDLIERLLARVPLLEDGKKVTIPEHTGGFNSGEIQMRKITLTDTLTTTSDLVTVEGQAPGSYSLNIDTVTSQLSQYAASIIVTDVMARAGIDNIMDEANTLLGERMGRLLHLLTIAALESGATNITYGGSATSVGTLGTSDVITSTVIKKAVRDLENRNAQPFPDGFWRAVIHPSQKYDLMADTQWRNVGEYNGGVAASGGPNILKGELGELHGVRFRTTTDLTQLNTGGGGAVPYAKSFIYTADAWACFDFASMGYGTINADTLQGVKIDMELPGTSSKADKHGQYGYVAALVAYACKVIDANKIQQLVTAVSA